MEKTIKQDIVKTKSLLCGLQDVKKSFETVSSNIKREVEHIQNMQAKEIPVIPEIDYKSILNGSVSNSQIADIKRRGSLIIRDVFDEQQAKDWNDEVVEYILRNDYYTKSIEREGMDQYFSQLKSGAPQIFGIYWSKPQMIARQSNSMANTKKFLNSLWDVSCPSGIEFDPNHDYVYADRIRRREPGDITLGLSPHIDGGSFERWVDSAFQKVYGSVFNGDCPAYDPWKAAYRTQTREYKSPAVCSMFRTFQGWTALTSQGPSDGTLSVIPIANAMSYILLRALQKDISPGSLCDAEPGRPLNISSKYHKELMDGLVSIQEVKPGDTVWWHPDVTHSVADRHSGKDYSNVMFIGASPKCQKNLNYVRKQTQRFLQGKSPPDFAAEDYEVDFNGRFMVEELTDLGRTQMAL
tara:strand:- start:21 stop:1250 length:1230 start_codon:yes stop_codon:yes gene_type:complete